MTKRAVIQVRVSEGEKSGWTRWAADEGVSLSELIRRVMVARLAVADFRASGEGVGSFAVAGAPLVSVVAPSVREGQDAVERVRGYELPSAAQVAKRPFKSDFK